MKHSKTNLCGLVLSTATVLAVSVSGLSLAETSTSDEIPDCVAAEGSTLQFVGPRRLMVRCAATESGCRVTYKLTLDDLGLAMDVEVLSVEPGGPETHSMWLRPGQRFVGQAFNAGPTHCLVHYIVEGTAGQ